MTKQTKNDINCRRVVTNIISTLHSSKVTPFIGSNTDVQTTALVDHGEYIVDSVIAHRANPQKISSLAFLIRCLFHST